jgi:hypothetical protein
MRFKGKKERRKEGKRKEGKRKEEMAMKRSCYLIHWEI